MSEFISHIQSTVQKTILDLYESNHFVIPSYQRPYAWTEIQIRNLFFDYVEACKKDTKHFIGSILVYRPNDTNKNQSYIIDGQQRTVSCLLMCIALTFYVNTKYKKSNVKYQTNQIPSITRNFGIGQIGELNALLQHYCSDWFTFSHYKINEKEKYQILNNLIKKINDHLENADNDNIDKVIEEIKSELKINNSEKYNYIHNLRIFYNLISEFVEKSSEDFALLQNYKHDKEYLEIKRIEVLCKEIKRIKFVEIVVNDSDYAHEIFEVINTQGVNLNNYELIRSFLIFQDESKLQKTINRVEDDITKLSTNVALNRKKVEKKRIQKTIIKNLTDFYLYFSFAFCLDCNCPLVNVNRHPNIIAQIDETKSKKTQYPEYQKFKVIFNTFMSDRINDVIDAIETYLKYYIFIKFGNNDSIKEILENKLTPNELKLITNIYQILSNYKSTYIPELMFLLRRFLADHNQKDYLIDKNIFLLLTQYIFSQIILQPSESSKIKFLHKSTDEVITSAKEFFANQIYSENTKINFINSLLNPTEGLVIHLLNIYKNHPDSDENRIQTSTSKEHIIPQTISENWKNIIKNSLNNNPELAKTFLKSVKDINNITESEYKQINNNAINALGNFILLEFDYNSGLQNKDWKDKRKVYKKSNFEEVTNQIQQKDVFSLEEVLEQTQIYGERIYNYCSSDNPVIKPIIDELNKEGFNIKY